MQSESVDDYLKTIYMIMEEQNGSPVSTSSLAARLGVKSASVTEMLKRLSSPTQKLVEYRKYYGVTLSPAGLKAAIKIIRHHRLIESYLSQKLGYSWDLVHAEADRLEHVISEEMEERLAIALGNPSIDPHGDPIPDREGNFCQINTTPLNQLSNKQSAIIQRITGQEPDLLRYLAEQGLILATRIQVVSKAPFQGPITICLANSTKSSLAIGWEMAEKILTIPLTDSL